MWWLLHILWHTHTQAWTDWRYIYLSIAYADDNQIQNQKANNFFKKINGISLHDYVAIILIEF